MPELVEDLIHGISPLINDANVPFALFGHSLGAWIAFAVAQELQKQGKPLPVALIVSGIRAPQLAGVQHDADGLEMHKLGPEEFWMAMENRYGPNKDLVSDHYSFIFFCCRGFPKIYSFCIEFSLINY